jgi:hypothetical protein
MNQPYRTPSERQEDETMDENTMGTIICKYIVMGVVTAFLLGMGTCAYTTHVETRGRVDVEAHKEEAAKAERDRAMFEAMARNPAPTK